ncbi:hypothetical protein FS837_004475 [Tulasnella sp. UAMH 9824]|nr:hypothetical protein FS837_004475 [Tulasnella sp. UAMH 9824]
MSHPVYLPSATIQPGNTSYRVETPPELDNNIEDESSDLELNDRAYALKIEQEIGLGQPTEAEMQANQATLYDWEKMKGDVRAEQAAKVTALSFLRDTVQKMSREDRFRATNLYAPPATVSQPTISAYPLTGPNAPPPPSLNKAGPTGGGTRGVSHSYQYALPAETPVESVPNASGWLNSGEIVDRLLEMAIDTDRAKAESVRGGVLGGGLLLPAGETASKIAGSGTYPQSTATFRP